MAYEDYEVSVESSEPIELLEIAIGSTIYRLVNQIDEFSLTGDIYTPHSFEHSNITNGQENVKFTMDAEHEYPKKYTIAAPGQVATITLRAVQRDDSTDVKVIYKGVVRTVSFIEDMTKAAVNVIPITAAFDKEIPDRTYQAGCNHVLFTNECSVNQFSYRYQGVVATVASNVVTITGLETAKGDGWSTGGFVGFGSDDYRLILEQDGDDLILNLAFYGDVLGETLDVFAGCAHDISTCNTKFSNVINFGGCPYVPTKNIFETGID